MFSRNILFTVTGYLEINVVSIVKICKSRMIFNDGKQHMKNNGRQRKIWGHSKLSVKLRSLAYHKYFVNQDVMAIFTENGRVFLTLCC